MTTPLYKQREKLQRAYDRAKRNHKPSRVVWKKLRDITARELKRYPTRPDGGLPTQSELPGVL